MEEGAKAHFLALRTLHPEEIPRQPPPSSKSSAVLENHPHPLVESMPTLCSRIHELCFKVFCFFVFYNAEMMHSICGLKHVRRVFKKKSATLTLYKLHQTNTSLTSFQQCLRLQRAERESYIETVKIVTLISSDFDTSVRGRPRCTVFNSTRASASQWQS